MRHSGLLPLIVGCATVAALERDGADEHGQAFDAGTGTSGGSRLVTADVLQAAGQTMDLLLQAKVRRTEDVRAALVRLGTGIP